MPDPHIFRFSKRCTGFLHVGASPGPISRPEALRGNLLTVRVGTLNGHLGCTVAAIFEGSGFAKNP